MNDRFRFRVWDIENRRYAEFIYENFYEYLTMPNRCVVEQCTGLKDKNGRLIYEGDILKIANGSINGRIFPINKPVKWVNNEACFDLPIWGYDSNGNYKDDWSHWFEVIGNIHENPELLEEKGKKYE